MSTVRGRCQRRSPSPRNYRTLISTGSRSRSGPRKITSDSPAYDSRVYTGSLLVRTPAACTMISAGAIDIAQPDVAKTGGLTELLKIAALCEAHGVEFVPHCALFGPGQVATIHLSAAHRSTPIFERLFCDFEVELYGDATIPKNGKIKVPTGPGLGLE